MRILVISDVHANLSALEAVISATGEFDATWCLGDLVGYGPDPNECVDLVSKLPNLVCIVGNHDVAALQQIDVETFNPEARQAIQWTQENLWDATHTFLSGLPEKVDLEDVTLTHGSPRHPVWEYLLDTRTATLNFSHFDTPYCFVGHTHLPILYHLDDHSGNARLTVPETNTCLTLEPRSIINPGSVGQPRDRDPRAAFALYNPDDHTWEYRRVSYDIAAVQARMTAAGLPQRHIQRLSAGW